MYFLLLCCDLAHIFGIGFLHSHFSPLRKIQKWELIMQIYQTKLILNVVFAQNGLKTPCY